jgi:translation initiation factor 3 subunit H
VTVAGALLGMEHLETGVVEVTNCFPQPSNPEAADKDGDDPYEVRMMKGMRDAGIDYNDVGWYTSTYLGSYFLKDTIEHQADFQAAVPNAVMLVYDNVHTATGNLSIKAVRLTKEFMESWKATGGSGRMSADAFARLVPSAVFEELPVRLHNPHLVNALVLDIADSRSLARASAPAATGDRVAGVGRGAAAPVHGSGDMDPDMARLDLNTGEWGSHGSGLCPRLPPPLSHPHPSRSAVLGEAP